MVHPTSTARSAASTGFRPEIAGLRAIAVVSVVMFHLKVAGTPGGFAGVDVFFVISGYLITRNILTDLGQGRFSFGQFYVRRSRRIFPALIFTVLATYVAGALWCSPLMFLDLAKECTHALLSIANIQYWRESHQYFAQNSDQLALLHFWSLSAEEQFYLVWPLFIVLAARIKRTFEAISLAAIVSLAGAMLVARRDPAAAFFLTPFRIFEFAAGAMVLRLEQRFPLSGATAEIVSAAGVLTILCSVVLLNPDLPYLETAVALPCLGAAATIWAGATPNMSRLMANPAMIGTGAISYSLYLCHWPIIFFARFIFGEAAADGPTSTVLMIILMLVVATAMYFLIERAFIQPHGRPTTPFARNAVQFAAVILPLAALTHATYLSKGFPWRLPDSQAELAHLQGFPDLVDLEPVYGPLRFELVGDSFAGQYIAGLSRLARSMNQRFDIIAGAGCPMLEGVRSKSLRRDVCTAARDEALRHLKQTGLPVIYAQDWELYEDAAIEYEPDPSIGASSGARSYAKLRAAIERTMQELLATGRRILIIGAQVKASCAIDRPRLLQGPLPHAPVPPCPLQTRQAAEAAAAPIDQMLAQVQARWPDRIQLIRPVDYFCDSVCPVVKDGVWLYYNFNHFSVAGSRYMVERSQNVFRAFLKD
jgi:peptidoglycan/LPS O-acetylase OafA/YrhL